MYHYFVTDHAGNVRAVLQATGAGTQPVRVQKTDYYPYGLAHQYDNVNLNKYLHSGKELQAFALAGAVWGGPGTGTLNLFDFGSRYYNPVLGRWANIDPALQFANPYLYAANNPVMYTDPDGEFVWMVPLLIGGVINWASNGCEFSLKGLAYFGAGVAGTATAMIPGFGAMGAGAVTGMLNNTLNQGFNNGWSSINPGQILTSGVMAGMTAGAGKALGGLTGPTLDKLFPTASSPLLAETVKGGVNGSIMGFGLNTGMALANGENMRSALKSGLEGASIGLAYGAIGGIGTGYIYARENNVNPFSGQSNVRNSQQAGSYLVYEGVDGSDNTKYVGITKRDPEVRFNEHLNSGTERAELWYRPIKGATGLSKTQARIWEQNLINKHGMVSNGGTLFNKINSIAPVNWEKNGITY